MQQEDTGADAYVDYDEEVDEGPVGQELMEVDGRTIALWGSIEVQRLTGGYIEGPSNAVILHEGIYALDIETEANC